MDLNTARGIVAIRKTDYTLRALRGNKHSYFSNPEYWLYNSTDVPKYRTEPFTYTDEETGEEVTVSETAAMKLGIDNLLQVGDLPTLGGVIQPVKYWKTTAGGSLALKGPAARDAADAAEAQELQRVQRKAHVERKIQRHTRRLSAQAARDAGDITQAELDGVNAEA